MEVRITLRILDWFVANVLDFSKKKSMIEYKMSSQKMSAHDGTARQAAKMMQSQDATPIQVSFLFNDNFVGQPVEFVWEQTNVDWKENFVKGSGHCPSWMQIAKNAYAKLYHYAPNTLLLTQKILGAARWISAHPEGEEGYIVKVDIDTEPNPPEEEQLGSGRRRRRKTRRKGSKGSKKRRFRKTRMRR
jgi:hypothetical protein